ncbi:MAG: VWA domain-containing protein [Acidobacteriota bacterium]|nr:VWA domain-containing protein [Acidobacteriota bacterium]
MRRFLFAVTLVLFSSVAQAADAPAIPWHSVPAAAIAVAKAQGKMLLVYARRADCERCNEPVEAMFDEAAKDEIVLGRILETFLPLRIDETSPAHPIVNELTRSAKPPVVAIYDVSGLQLTMRGGEKWKWATIAELLLRFRGSREIAARSAALRLEGQTPAADYLAGYVLLNAREWRRAADRFDLSARAYEAAHETESQQLAEVPGAHAWFVAGMKKRGLMTLQEIIRQPASPIVAAEAYFRMGAMEEASATISKSIPNSRIATPGGKSTDDALSMQTVTTKDMRAMGRALTAYRKSYELAAPGSATLAAAKEALARLDDRPLPPKDKSVATVRLIPPARQTITGEAEFLAEVSGKAAHVDFFLDDKKVATQMKAPFRAAFDVGPTARARTIKARAFDVREQAIGEAAITINDRADAFLVNIVSPATDVLEGTANAEVDVRVPPGRNVKSVELSWNGKPFATLTRPPFRAPVTVTSGEIGYLRGVATLDDGTTAEGTKLFNTVTSEMVEVGAVTLIASVTDGAGKRIRGLQSKDFAVLDEGSPVAPTLRSAEDEPVTIGIAVDSSSSMAGKQLYVIRAAADFLGRGLRPQDEAFVVAFDNSARLVHPRSHDAASLRSAVLDLVPSGGTSMFDGLTFALQQFQGIPGKRALIVLSDGREGTSSASARECARLARQIGVPVYVIVPPGGAKSEHALTDIAEATGGLMFHATPIADLPQLSDRIAEEVRGQYVLSFTRPAGVRSGSWRTVRVNVRGRDATVRTIQGYRAN